MRLALILRLAALGLLFGWLAMLFAVTTADFRTNELKPMTTWQTIVKMTRIIVHNGGALLRQDTNVERTTILAPRDANSDEFVDVSPPERAGAFLFVVFVGVGLLLMLVGAVIGLLPKWLMVTILSIIGFFAFMYYLNQRPLIPLYMKMPDAAVYVIMFKTIGAVALAFASGLFFALGRRAARRATPV